jgi:opacity protein-like surface antigen
MMKRNNRFTQIIAAVVGCFVIATSGYAQQTERGKLEATGQLGVVTGIGTHVSLGTSIGTAVSDRVFAFGEFSWIPLGGASTTIQSPNNFFELATGGRILSFMAGAHYQFRQTRSFIPYAGASLGVVHGSGSTTQTIGGTTTSTSFSNDSFYVGLSGGARYYMNDNWGFKPELTIFAGDDAFVRFGGGIFYQFGQ